MEKIVNIARMLNKFGLQNFILNIQQTLKNLIVLIVHESL